MFDDVVEVFALPVGCNTSTRIFLIVLLWRAYTRSVITPFQK
jgi:hypothetical protein